MKCKHCETDFDKTSKNWIDISVNAEFGNCSEISSTKVIIFYACAKCGNVRIDLNE